MRLINKDRDSIQWGKTARLSSALAKIKTTGEQVALYRWLSSARNKKQSERTPGGWHKVINAYTARGKKGHQRERRSHAKILCKKRK
jgi:hypothetical protein